MHLIHQQHIEVKCTEKPLAHLIKDELSGVFEHDLYPKLEALMDRYDVPDGVWKIERLTIEVPPIPVKNWKRELVDATLQQVEQFLKEHSHSYLDEASTISQEGRSSNKVSKERLLQDLLLYYLEKGSLPTNALVEKLDMLFEMVEIDSIFLEQLLLLLKKDIAVVLRWSLNVPLHFKEKLSKEIGIMTQWSHARKFLKKTKSIANSSIEIATVQRFGEFLFWISIFCKEFTLSKTDSLVERVLIFADDYFQITSEYILQVLKPWILVRRELELTPFSEVASFINKYLEDHSWEETKLQKELNEEEVKKDDIEAILEALQGHSKEKVSQSANDVNYIHNAGLVLLHPFLVPLFRKLGYLEESKWKSKKQQHRAILVLQYITNFDQEIFESDLLLNKILCGAGVTETVATEWEISEAEKEQCEKLLESVIEHWTILKNTSVKTLQETFLQRNGKLQEYKENTYELTVEQKGLDILLDHLPWGMGTIKTPWMEHYLSCYWG